MKPTETKTKDAYYFSHDSNAKDDPKIVLLIEELGMEGYGIYWMLVETLRDQPNYHYPTKLLAALARRYNSTEDKVRAVVEDYELFELTDEQEFYSDSLLRRMDIYLSMKKNKSNAGKKGNAVRWNKLVAEPSQCDNNAIAVKSQGKEIKEKENKGNLISDEKISLEVFLDSIVLPNDAIERNFEGLRRVLSNDIKLSPKQAEEVCRACNYGEIGHPIWPIFNEIKANREKILSPPKVLYANLLKHELL